jgi:hypothetical protein
MKLEVLLIPQDDNWIRIDIFTFGTEFEVHATSADRQVTIIERGTDKSVVNVLTKMEKYLP